MMCDKWQLIDGNIMMPTLNTIDLLQFYTHRFGVTCKLSEKKRAKFEIMQLRRRHVPPSQSLNYIAEQSS